MTLSDLLLPTYTQMLGTMSAWFDKAEAARGDAAVSLLAARLAPDMFPLSTQIRFACVQAQEGMYRLKAASFPPSIETLLDEGRNGGGHPGTLIEAKARIAEAVAIVETLAAEPIDEDEKRLIAHDLPTGMIFDLTAEQYVRDWTIPQFYFHVMTAYAILRNQGIALGKADYVPYMFAYLRAGTAG